MDDLLNERSIDSQATWVIDVLGLFSDVIYGSLNNQALAEVRLTGARIKCLNCIWPNRWLKRKFEIPYGPYMYM